MTLVVQQEISVKITMKVINSKVVEKFELRENLFRNFCSILLSSRMNNLSVSMFNMHRKYSKKYSVFIRKNGKEMKNLEKIFYL